MISMPRILSSNMSIYEKKKKKMWEETFNEKLSLDAKYEKTQETTYI